MELTIPYEFTPRPYQLDLFKAMDSGYNRAVLVWHRRCGKDKACFNYMVKKAIARKGLYFYIFPTYANGKKALWDNIDIQGFSMRNHIPDVLKVGENGQEMKITLKNGSIIQVVGTDGANIDRLRGTNPIGCVFSEYAFQNPTAWDIIRPILAANGGWSVFNSTPKGRNHWYEMNEMARRNDKWYLSQLTVNDTSDNDGNAIITKEMLEEELQSGMSKDMYDQEYFCSFDASIQGAFYTDYMRAAREEKRIGKVNVDPHVQVHTFWDIGHNDNTAIRWVQFIGKEIRVIDFYEKNGQAASHYVNVVQAREYDYGNHYLPHDAASVEKGSGKNYIQFLEEAGLRGTQIVPRPPKKHIAIEAVRRTLPHCWFDEDKCAHGLRCLNDYHREYDENNKVYRDNPKHDWASDAADAFSYMAMTWQDITNRHNDAPVEADFSEYL